jgi:transcriptional regulator with XRE-family HTH domain
MALFFDQAWFDARLAETGSTRADLARLLQLSEAQVAELWKDQRELRAGEVALIARFLNVPAAEVALRAGVSTPVPMAAPSRDDHVAGLEKRVDELERQLGDILGLLARNGFK